ncbi:hypothetical protein [Methylobacterium sp. 17Sr1-1]|uniref:hypothetical protein n=1 Tax=Methylobacterium sp. 17Sr1-1 TaxID=2202826 RepID=UPI000D6F3FC2|nr:hypothetical protein [Methylobacterium sp. 17Sr1-1]AWN55081.1 hypothetical protein DK412_28560 [Methylobacterium sp. 17Sr1-1]
MNQPHPPPTIDDIAVILPGLVRALGLIIEQMEPLLDLSCRATNLPEETADRMADIGQALTEHAHTLMREAARRRQAGPGRIALAPGPAEPSAV